MGENMRFVRQIQTIRVTNFDRLMIEKRYENMKTCYRFLYAVSSV